MPRGSEAAKEYPPTGTTVLPKKPGLRVVEKEKELKPKETEKEYRERVGRSRKRKAWTLFGALSGVFGSPAVAATAFEAALRAGSDHPIVQWYEGKIREPIVGSISSLFIKTPEEETIGEIVPTIVKEIKTPQEETKVEENTQKVETPPIATEVKEEQAGPIEYEGVMVPQITGLTFKEGVYYAQEGNPYGLEAEVKAGLFVKDAVEINENMESAIGLRPEVVRFIQEQAMKANNEFRFALPFDLREMKGIKIVEEEDYSLRLAPSLKEAFWDTPKNLLISNIPLGTKIYSAANSERYLIIKPKDNSFILSLSNLDVLGNSDFYFEDERVDSVEVLIKVAGANLIPSDLEKEVNKSENNTFITTTKIGLPIAEITRQDFLEVFVYDNETDKMDINSSEFSMTLLCCMSQYGESEEGKYIPTGYLQTGLDNLLGVKEKMPVTFILPANE